MEGIDIYSKFQTVTSWNQVRAADIGWCYQKVSDGTGTRTVQSPGAGRAAGVLQGGYHFSQPGDPVAQANLLVNQCTALGLLDLNPALDLEDNPPGGGANIPDSQKADFAVAFGRQVLARGHGFTLYANDSTWGLVKNRVMSALPSTFRWVARYRTAPPDNPYDAWQYTSSGSVPGISAGSVDRNKGKIPLNGGSMALDLSDKNFIIDCLGHSAAGRTGQNGENNLSGWWYNDRFEGNLNFAQVFFGMRDKVNALTTAITSLTNLVIQDAANDVTAQQVAEALQGLIVSEVVPAVHDALSDASVEVDNDAIANAVADTLRSRLLD